jgi:tRNA(Ile)-lysidine synthase
MRLRRGRIIRPLLQIGRAEVHAFLDASRLPFRTDATNFDLSFPRNRVRHEVLPALAQVSPAATRTIARAAGLAADDEDFLEAHAIERLPGVVLTDTGDVVTLDRAALHALHPAVGRRILRGVLARVGSRRFFGSAHVEAAWALQSGQRDLPGVQVLAEPGVLRIRRTEGWRRAAAKSNVFRYSLSIPGEASIPESGVAISAEIVISGPAAAEKVADEVAVPKSAVETERGLFVRNRRPGDRLRPAGMSGRRKLQDYMVDRKVPRGERDTVPIVVDGRDRIIWVVGHTVAEDFRVTDPREPVLLLKVRYFGGTV